MRQNHARCGAHLTVWTCLVLAGCQQYQRRPIDTGAILAEWRSRTADATAVRERAAADGRVFDLKDGMSADEAVAAALVFDPELNAIRGAAAVEGAGLEHVAPWPNPELNVDARRVVDSIDGGWQLGAGLGITIPLSGRRGAEKRSALPRAASPRASCCGASRSR